MILPNGTVWACSRGLDQRQERTGINILRQAWGAQEVIKHARWRGSIIVEKKDDQ